MSLKRLATDIASVISAADANTTGQYRDGIGSEDEERQVELLLEGLENHDSWYEGVAREVPYPSSSERCDLQLPDGTSVEVKLLRYWRANGDPEHYMPKQVVSPFHENTLLTDAQRLSVSGFKGSGGLLGLFYKRSDEDPVTTAHPEQFTAENLARKLRRDIEYWYGCTATVECVAPFSGLQHPVQSQGAAIAWQIE